MRVFAKLRKQSDYYNFNQPTLRDFSRDVSVTGLRGAMRKRQMWNRLRMNPTDLADVSGYTYTYLMNGSTPADNWTGLFRRGERVRLRFINSGAQSFFDVRIPGLKMTVVQVDGQAEGRVIGLDGAPGMVVDPLVVAAHVKLIDPVPAGRRFGDGL